MLRNKKCFQLFWASACILSAETCENFKSVMLRGLNIFHSYINLLDKYIAFLTIEISINIETHTGIMVSVIEYCKLNAVYQFCM